MKVVFSAKDKPQEWLETLAHQFETKVTNNAFEIPVSIGKGFLKQFYFFEGFTLTYLHFKLHEPLEFIRHSVSDAQLFPIMFYSHDVSVQQDIDEQRKLIGYHTSNGIFMPSPQIESKWMVPPGTEGYQITLTIEKNWFLQTFNHSDNIYLNQLLKSRKSFYLFESLQTSMKNLIFSIYDLINSKDKLQHLKLHQKAIELLNLFLEKVEQRTSKEDISGINASGIEKIFQTRKQLLENLTNVPPLKQLSANAGMSISKLQKCFQQVFGKSISQYALSEKMNLARQLFDTKKYSVSEVGYQLGYSNLSHFTKAFNKEFGINPKTYITNQ